jgi:predicted amidohydrolase YtcJ
VTERLLVQAGRVLDPTITEADTVLVEGDRIAAVGRADEFGDAGDADRRVIDLRPATLVPGFVDTHVHATGSGLPTAPADMRTDAPEVLLMRAV